MRLWKGLVLGIIVVGHVRAECVLQELAAVEVHVTGGAQELALGRSQHEIRCSGQEALPPVGWVGVGWRHTV